MEREINKKALRTSSIVLLILAGLLWVTYLFYVLLPIIYYVYEKYTIGEAALVLPLKPA